MWFKRKTRNRRFVREHILDVKIRSSQRRQDRLRQGALVGGLLFGVGLGLYLLWRGGEELLRWAVYENPTFAIQRLDIQTDGVIAPEQLRSWSGVRLRENLMRLDLARVKRDLELVPAIESVVVERVLPHTLRLRVTEREPVAQVVFPQLRAVGGRRVYTLDAAGWFMFPIEAHQRSTPPAQTNEHLPVISGITLADVRPGRQSESTQVLAALKLIQAFERSPMIGLADIRQIDLSSPNILTVATGQNSEVVFGLQDLDGQLRRWRLVHDHGQRTGRQLASLDLSVANNVPARWLEASAAPSPVPKASKPSAYRKKHV